MIHTDNLTQQSKFFHPTLKSIPAHATNRNKKLAEIKKLAQKIIENQQDFKSKGRTTNYVFPIKDENKTVGYLKIGRDGDEGSALMEEFAWNCSIFFSVSEFFTATEKFKISSDKVKKFSVDIEDVNTEEIKQYPLGDLSDLDSPRGSFQLAQNGDYFDKLIDNGFLFTDRIPNKTKAMQMLIKATLITLTFGMTDAHAKNIIIKGDGQIKFFDNARIFPHSNGPFHFGENLSMSYSSGLLESDESYEILFPEDLEFLKKEFKKLKLKFSRFKDFLGQKNIKELLQDLPKGWFNQEEVLSATQERLNNVEKALLNPKTNTLAGLIEASIPYYRFFAISQTINEILDFKQTCDLEFTEDELMLTWKHAMICGSVNNIRGSLAMTSSIGINLETLLNICSKDISYPELIKLVIPLYKKAKIVQSASQNNTTRRVFNSVMKKMYDHSKIDLKDVPANSIYYCIDTYIIKYLRYEGFPINKSKHPYTVKITKGAFGESSSYKLVYINSREEKVTKNLSVYEKPGKITLRYIGEKLSMTIPDLGHWARMKCVE